MSEREEPDHGATAQSTTPGIVWYVLGVAFLAVVAWVGFEYLGWLVFGVFTYYVGRPIMSRLLRVVNSRSLAAALTLLFIIVPILLFIAAFLSVALGQALTFLSTDEVAAVLEELPFPSTDLPTDPIEIVIVVLQGPELSALLNEFGLVLGTFATVLFNVFLMLIFAFFLLVDDKRLAAWFVTNVLGPESPSTNYLRRVDRGLTSVYFGYTLTIFVVILLAAVIYTLFNVFAPPGVQIPAAILLAVVTGVFTLIPLVGRSIVYAFIVALLSIQAFDVDPTLLWIPLLFFALMVVVFDNVVRTYIRPYLSGKAYDMGLVMFAYLLGPVLFGWYGIFMGPLLMVLVVEFVVLILPRLAGVKPWRVSGPGETGLSGGILDHEPNSDQSTPSTDSGSGGAPSGDR
jgi:predicted PurR-regulated permease PerM